MVVNPEEFECHNEAAANICDSKKEASILVANPCVTTGPPRRLTVCGKAEKHPLDSTPVAKRRKSKLCNSTS